MKAGDLLQVVRLTNPTWYAWPLTNQQLTLMLTKGVDSHNTGNETEFIRKDYFHHVCEVIWMDAQEYHMYVYFPHLGLYTDMYSNHVQPLQLVPTLR